MAKIKSLNNGDDQTAGYHQYTGDFGRSDFFTEQEDAVFHRGRNIGHTNHPKGATVGEYRNATGMEALFGYLKMTGEEARIRTLFEAAYPKEDTREDQV